MQKSVCFFRLCSESAKAASFDDTSIVNTMEEVDAMIRDDDDDVSAAIDDGGDSDTFAKWNRLNALTVTCQPLDMNKYKITT